jgi:hypothetical protein
VGAQRGQLVGRAAADSGATAGDHHDPTREESRSEDAVVAHESSRALSPGDLPLERWYRELRIRRVGEGPSEVQRLIAARDLIGGSFT